MISGPSRFSMPERGAVETESPKGPVVTFTCACGNAVMVEIPDENAVMVEIPNEATVKVRFAGG